MSIFGTPQFQNKAGAGAAPAVNTTGGDLLVAALAGNSSTTSFSLADTATNTFIGLGSPISSGFNKIQMFYCIGAKGNAANVLTPTANGSGAAMQGIAVWDFPITGGTVGGTIPSIDSGAGAPQGSGTSTAFATSSFNTSGTDELVVCGIVNSVGETANAQAGFTLDASGAVTHSWSSLGTGCAEHGLLTSPQSAFVAQMTGASSTQFAAVAAAFMAPGAAGGGNAPVVVIM